MGDVGSLALGGLLAAISILLRQEWTLLLIGLVYVCETASVILQVASFKLFGKRILKCLPFITILRCVVGLNGRLILSFGPPHLFVLYSHYG